ncbi:MAG: WbqC family protein [Candidatus Methylomirabilales bacterium]
MRVAVHQPQYLPWLGYFDKIDQVDCFVLLDDVQFKKNEWQNRNRIKTAAGWQWLTVPVLHRSFQRISEVRINPTVPWARKHLQALISNYTSAPFFDLHRPFFDDIYARAWGALLDLNMVTITYLVEALRIRTKLVMASSLPLPAELEATERLVAICQALEADTYLSGAGGRGYLDLTRFEEAGIRVLFQAFQTRPYPQRFEAFVPDLSVVDLLFNCNGDSLHILQQGRMADEDPGNRGPSG